MKAISLWQPWASAIAVGAKRVETRSWATNYRGPLAIHAAKRCVFDELCHYHSSWKWTGALWPLGWGMQPGLPAEQRNAPLKTKLPFGAVVAVCRLVDCRPTGSFTQSELDAPCQPAGADPKAAYLYEWTERQMGDFSLGRFGWVLGDVVRVEPPVPCRGAQGLFDLPEEVVSLLPGKPPHPCPGLGGSGPPCCDRAGEYNGLGSDAPLSFVCPNHCGCHD